MEKFRVLSDIHADIQDPIFIEDGKKYFTVLCGDTSGDTKVSIRWIRKNLSAGVCCSGNHLPYSRRDLTVQEYRDELHKAFTKRCRMTYLDAECGIVSKAVDGILFVGSCMYSDMRISSKYNPDGDVDINKRVSHKYMNDYRWGIIGKRETETGGTECERMTPDDYERWFKNAYSAMDSVISENEKTENPMPVVVITHYPLVKDVLEHSFYVDTDNFASYGSDMARWLLSHPSVKCHCCGHCHDMDKDHRAFKIFRKDGSHVLVVNNSYGYRDRCHDITFNPNRFVNVNTWEMEEIPESAETVGEKKLRQESMLSKLAWFF